MWNEIIGPLKQEEFQKNEKAVIKCKKPQKIQHKPW